MKVRREIKVHGRHEARLWLSNGLDHFDREASSADSNTPSFQTHLQSFNRYNFSTYTL